MGGRVRVIERLREQIERGVGGHLALQQDVRPSDGQLQPLPGDDQPWRQLLDDLEQGRHLGLFEQVGFVILDEVDGKSGIAGRQRVFDGIVEPVVFFEPQRRGAMQLRDPLRIVALEPAAQKLGEHLVVVKPARFPVDRLQKQATLGDLLQQRLAPGHLRQGRSQIRAYSLGNRGGQDEIDDLGFQ